MGSLNISFANAEETEAKGKNLQKSFENFEACTATLKSLTTEIGSLDATADLAADVCELLDGIIKPLESLLTTWKEQSGTFMDTVSAVAQKGETAAETARGARAKFAH